MERIDIEIFQAIITHKNIQKASEALYMSATTAGARLKNLEDELGVQLFERSKGMKTVALTEKGKQFIPLADQMLSMMNACHELKDADERIPVSIATADGFLNDVFYSFYRKVMQKTDMYDLNIQRYPSDMIYQMISNQKVDIGLALYKVQQRDVIVRKIFQEDIVVIVKDDGRYRTRSIAAEELDPAKEYLVASEDSIYVGGGPEMTAWHRERFEVDIRPKLRINNISMAYPFLRGSDYWMLVSRSNAMELKKNYPIKILELKKTAPKSICYLLTNRSLSSKKQMQVDAFINSLKEHLSKYKQIEILK